MRRFHHITSDSIILCDIDDTILIPTQMLGCDEGFYALMQKYKEEGFSLQDALKRALDEVGKGEACDSLYYTERGAQEIRILQ